MSWIKDMIDESREILRRAIDDPKFAARAPGSPLAIGEAIRTNEWGLGGGLRSDNERTSWDDLLGGWGAESPRHRQTGRAVGTYMAGSALAGAGEGAAGAETGASADFGLTGMEGAAEQGVASEFAANAGLEPLANEALSETVADTAAREALSETALETAPLTEAASQGAETGLESLTESAADTAAREGLQQTATKPGILEGAMNWVNAKPINTAITYGAISQGASALLQARAAEKQRQAEREAMEERLDYPRRIKTGNPSVGGGGVNINMRPRPRPPGLIQGRMSGRIRAASSG